MPRYLSIRSTKCVRIFWKAQRSFLQALKNEYFFNINIEPILSFLFFHLILYFVHSIYHLCMHLCIILTFQQTPVLMTSWCVWMYISLWKLESAIAGPHHTKAHVQTDRDVISKECFVRKFRSSSKWYLKNHCTFTVKNCAITVNYQNVEQK